MKEIRWVCGTLVERAGNVALPAAVAVLAAALFAAPASADECVLAADADVAAALARIEASVDPCGRSAELRRVVDAFRRCWGEGCRLCVDRARERNTTERGEPGEPITITWNPDLRTELESGCGGDATAVTRDPIASLAHELVHAAQALAGADFTETDAVQVENVYRRANRLCQRTRYGEDPLPRSILIDCTPGQCTCGADAPATILAGTQATDAGMQTAGDLAGTQP